MFLKEFAIHVEANLIGMNPRRAEYANEGFTTRSVLVLANGQFGQ